MLKKCGKCNKEKEFSEFSKHKTKKDGLQSECKSCRKEINKKYIEDNRGYFKEYHKEYNKEYFQNKKEYYKEYNKEWREKNKEKRKEYYKEYRENNKDKTKEYVKKYNKNNKEKRNEYIKNKKQTNILFKLRCDISSRISQSIRNKGFTKSSQTYKILGCTFEEFKLHLENQFKDGMSWENAGLYGWHLDHIYPVSLAKDEEELIKLNHYTNFQPLWAEDNLKKGNKII